jgi:hypothetical protein
MNLLNSNQMKKTKILRNLQTITLVKVKSHFEYLKIKAFVYKLRFCHKLVSINIKNKIFFLNALKLIYKYHDFWL